MAETIRLEEFTGVIQNKVIAIWTESVWLPTEFMLTQYITRILVTGRASPVGISLSADPSWTQVWRSPGAKEWSCLLGVLQHMPGPVLIVVTPDIVLTPKILSACAAATTIVLRSASVGWPSGADAPSHVFFPVLGTTTAGLMPVVQDWVGRAAPRSLDLKALVPQLAATGYALMVAEGLWHWYKPADSPPLATLTVAQVARQLQVLGSMLEKMVV
jgi:hypothetical protein